MGGISLWLHVAGCATNVLCLAARRRNGENAPEHLKMPRNRCHAHDNAALVHNLAKEGIVSDVHYCLFASTTDLCSRLTEYTR